MTFGSHKQKTFFLSSVLILSISFFQCKPEEKSDDSAALLLLGAGGIVPSTNTTGTITTPQNTNLRVFVTAATYNGNLGGINGADTKCANDANKPTSGTFKAFITGDSGPDGVRYACLNDAVNCPTNPVGGTKNWVLQANKSYYRIDQSTVVYTTNANGFVSTIPNQLQAGAADYWTGFVPGDATDWSRLEFGNCEEWTSDNAISEGTKASATGTTIVNIKGNLFISCDQFKSLLCVEQ
ncbi:DUF1554 domain-containing protein [Leptospira stimsonii]|uniref:DUF1554 domain-containing protein n=1 Tax=Leptospira stimsonii TaxID=2202203 RepID=A0A396YVR3_9LEPT|nr:DUF1554 domain-containing protein [Leptospira stimsonii]RHX85518.1 hypothetical protein DLM75_21405 [Leptospira stimsonii]